MFDYDIVLLFSVFNRYEKTINTINYFDSIFRSNDIKYKIVVVDDMSTDETSKLISSSSFEILRTSGDFFYTRSMDYGFDWIKKNILSYRALLCINDDVIFDSSIVDFIKYGLYGKMDILVGSCLEDTKGSNLSYGFMKAKLFNVSNYRMLNQTNPIDFDAFNFNCVFIRSDYLKRFGFFDSTFIHSKGDIDFSLCAKKNKASVVGFMSVIGVCEKNDGRVTPYDKNISIKERFSLLLSVKWHPVKENIYFHKKHNPYFWFLSFPIPYLKWVFSLVR